MIINDEEAKKRLQSPMNLINKLKTISSSSKSSRNNAMSLFIPSHAPLAQDRALVEITPEGEQGRAVQGASNFNPFPKQEQASPEPSPSEPFVKLNDLLENSEAQINLGLAHDSALKLLNSSVNLLTTKLDDIRADKLPSVVSAASKVVESIRRERSEAAKNGKNNDVHYHFYTPQQKTMSDFEVIDVGGVPA